MTRIPPYRPGIWVKLKEAKGCPPDLAGKVRQVKSLTCSITAADQRSAVWRVHFHDGRCVEWHAVDREATEAEIRLAS